MKIQVLRNETYNSDATLPVTATSRSTGYDIIATSDPEIIGEKSETGYSRIDYIQYKTNLKIAVLKDQYSMGTSSGIKQVDVDYDVLAMPRSGVSKYNLILTNCVGLIDADYRGEILLRFKYIWQPEDYLILTKSAGDGMPLYSFLAGKPNLNKIYKKGDTICQLKITKVEHVEFCLVDTLDKTDRGEGGFGSTDKKTNTATPIIPEETLVDMVKNYKKTPVYTPVKKYSDLMKEKENNI